MNRAIIAIALFSCCWLAVARQHRGEEYGGYKYISSCKLRYAPEVPPYDYDKGNMQSSPELGEEAVDADVGIPHAFQTTACGDSCVECQQCFCFNQLGARTLILPTCCTGHVNKRQVQVQVQAWT